MKEKAARVIAQLAHDGQTYGDGPYIDHVWRVVERVGEHQGSTSDDVVLAWLHDTVEDTVLSFVNLQDLGYDTRDLRLITRRGSWEAYAEYIKRVRLSPSAVRVKIADLCDNLAHSPTESRRAKYESALEVLRAW